jgi:hypothetical protein
MSRITLPVKGYLGASEISLCFRQGHSRGVLKAVVDE